MLQRLKTYYDSQRNIRRWRMLNLVTLHIINLKMHASATAAVRKICLIKNLNSPCWRNVHRFTKSIKVREKASWEISCDVSLQRNKSAAKSKEAIEIELYLDLLVSLINFSHRVLGWSCANAWNMSLLFILLPTLVE